MRLQVDSMILNTVSRESRSPLLREDVGILLIGLRQLYRARFCGLGRF